MATRFQDLLGLLVLLRACDCKVKAEMHPAPQPALQTGEQELTLRPWLLLSRPQVPSVSHCVSPAEGFLLPLLEQDSTLCGAMGPLVQLLYPFVH